MKKNVGEAWLVAIVGGVIAIYLFHEWGVVFAALACGYALLVSF